MVMRSARWARIAIAIGLFLSAAGSGWGQSIPLDALPSGAVLQDVTATPSGFRGRKALRVELAVTRGTFDLNFDAPTFVVIPADFTNGTIAVDLVGQLNGKGPATARGFVGLAFRIRPDISSFEAIYLRPTNGRDAPPPRNEHAIQYYAYPDWKFDRKRKESPGKYEKGADIGPGEWIHFRIVVDGAVAKAYINDQPEPTLVVNDLKLGAGAQGAIGLWVGNGTEAYFANLVVTPKQ
jgi:hypothetical protein